MTPTPTPITIPERVSPALMKGGRGHDTALSMTDIFTMLRRRMLLLLVLGTLLVLAFSAGFAAWWFYFPGYRSECLIECVSNVPSTGLTIDHAQLRQEEHERFVSTQALVLKSPAILGEALKINSVRETQWYQSVTNRKRQHLLELTDELVASPVRGTNFLRVALEARQKGDPAVIVDAVVRLWLDTVKRRSADEFATQLQIAQGERESLDRRIEDKRKELKAIAARLPPGVRQDPANNLAAQEARQLAEQAAVLRLELSQLDQLRTVYNNPASVAVTAEDRALVEQDPQVMNLRNTLFLLQQQHAADSAKYGAGHAVAKTISGQIETSTNMLGQLQDQRLAEIQSKNREDVNTAYENNKHALYLVEERLARADAVLKDQDGMLFDYINIEAEITESTEFRRKLSDFITDLERVVRQRSAITVNVAQPATEPLRRSSPSLFMIPVGFFLAWGIAIGLSLGLEWMDKSVQTTQDVARCLDVPILGAVPDTDDEEMAIQQVETAIRDAPRSMVAEAFRRIRTNLQFCAPAQGQRTVVVTSARPDDGKTTVACNLAMAVAQGGKRVLLVDANFRRPAVNRVFALEGQRGLSNILVGEATLESLVVPTPVQGLDALVSGPAPPNPSELLGSEPFRAFLQTASTRYDQVIVDTSPILIATDALVAGSAVDGVILVIRARRNSRGVAQRASGLLADVNARVFGAVLNAAQVTRGGYFREQLRSFYEYQQPGT